MREANLEIIKRLKAFLVQVKEDPSLRHHFTPPEAFTKNRKLPLERMVYLIISLLKRSLSIELEDFFQSYYPEHSCASKAALSKQRQKLDYSFFTLWNSVLVKSFYECYQQDVKRWNGFRLMAIDGSTAYLINKPDLITHFGVQSNQSTSIAMGQIMELHDILNDLTVCSAIYPIDISEQQVAYQWIPYLEPDTLTIYDRGYPSFSALYLHLEQEQPLHFVMRCRTNFNKEVIAFMSSVNTSQAVTFKATDIAIQELKKHGYRLTKASTIVVRLIKVKLADGSTETLITSLLDENEYPESIFSDLYFKRWGIETSYAIRKNNQQMEVFSGYKVNTVLQDFYAGIFVGNLQNILSKPAQSSVTKKTRGRKYHYKINKNVALGLLKRHLIRIFIEIDPEQIIIELESLFERYTEPIRPSRSYPREVKGKRAKGKYQTLTNYKRAI
ncbi:IS4 family transposase [Daejeonella sp.]|uniref:IS4 family transposase n=1 Tax=Daejeonella sp. TaxID=2805397 RepID=UPI003983B836